VLAEAVDAADAPAFAERCDRPAKTGRRSIIGSESLNGASLTLD